MANNKFKIYDLPQISAAQISSNCLAVLENSTSYKCQITNTSAAIAGSDSTGPVMVDAKAIKDYVQAQQYVPTTNTTNDYHLISNHNSSYVPTCSAVYDYVKNISGNTSSYISDSDKYNTYLVNGKAVHDYIKDLSGYSSTNIDNGNQKFVTGNAVYNYINGLSSNNVGDFTKLMTGNAVIDYARPSLCYTSYAVTITQPKNSFEINLADNNIINCKIADASGNLLTSWSGTWYDTFNVGCIMNLGISVNTFSYTFHDYRTYPRTSKLNQKLAKFIFILYCQGLNDNGTTFNIGSNGQFRYSVNDSDHDQANSRIYHYKYDPTSYPVVKFRNLAIKETMVMNFNEIYFTNDYSDWIIDISYIEPYTTP